MESLASQGLSDQQISDALGISLSTLKRHKKLNEPFWTALKKGRATGVAAIANKLFTKAQGGDIAAIIFFLKTRGGFLEAGAQDEEKRQLELERLRLANEKAQAEIDAIRKAAGNKPNIERYTPEDYREAQSRLDQEFGDLD
ncbi:hypothetical protein FMK81_13250 [Klebsiella oxytoca]|uniref:hypothetical protein n=1 Tax=Klebsiella oxytoca TaxID=571 RepID=UPI001CCC2A31|nr:hypothetical protein [Klebsiella oxytoca]MBZ7262473.1 hypothetical protein [Klebsiella oxytoca]